MLSKNPYVIGGTALIATIAESIGFFKELNTNLPELSEASTKANSEFTQFTEAASRIRTASERIQDLRFSGDKKGAAREQLKLEQILVKTKFDTPQLKAEAISSLRDLNFKSLEQSLNENTQALLKNKQGTELSESVLGGIEAGKFADVGKILFNQGQQEVLNQELETGKKQDFNFGQYGDNIRKVIGDVNELTRPAPNTSAERQKRAQLKKSVIDQLSNIPGLDLLAEGIQNGTIAAQKLPELLKSAADAAKEFENAENEIARLIKQGGPSAQAIKDSLDNARTAFEEFARSGKVASQLQLKLNDVIKKAIGAVKINNLSNQSDIFETLGATDLARQFGIESEVAQIQSDFSDSIAEPLQALNDALLKIQFGKVEQGLQPSLDKNNVEKGLKDAQAASIENINNLIKTIDRSKIGEGTIGEGGLKENGIDSLMKSITESEDYKNIIKNASEEQLKELPSLLQQVVSATLGAKTIQEQQLRILAQNKTAELVKQLIQATQKAFGGLEGFRNVDPNDAFGQNLFDLREGIADIKNIRAGGLVGPEGNIE